MAHLFQTQWAICPNGFEFWAEPWPPLTYQECTESCFHHPLFNLRGSRKVEIRHTNFHFSSKKVTSKSQKVEVFDLTIVKKLSTFRPKKAKVEKLKSRKVGKLKSRKVEKLKSGS